MTKLYDAKAVLTENTKRETFRHAERAAIADGVDPATARLVGLSAVSAVRIRVAELAQRGA